MDVEKAIQYEDSYHSIPIVPSYWSRTFPSIQGHYVIMKEILRCACSIRKSNPEESFPFIMKHMKAIVIGLEEIGIEFIIDGMNNVKAEPVIIIANHMSSLETILTPIFAGGVYPVSFVSKRSVMSYPLFNRIFSKLYPLLIDRINPREDFKTVMREGERILKLGRNLVIFVQGTRTKECKEEDFSSIGIKLAKSTGYPVVPLALKTDAWHVGSIVKDIGYMLPIPVRYKFFPRIHVTSTTGKEEHILCTRQICSTVNKWIEEDSKHT